MATGFVDEARILVRSGSGGQGIVAFQREKYKPKGGPGGGDGGHGGSVVLIADHAVGSLAEHKIRRRYEAPSGERGGPNRRRGADASDCVITVPVGTVVRDAETGQMLADLARPGTRYLAARGGRGGRGNASMVSAADRAPTFAEGGEPPEEHALDLELRLVADVGLLGPPNAGKSTLLRSVSRASPKVGAYPFTTIEPHLGVAEAGDERMVIADLPGLIEGAAGGKGLGVRFLRHTERCLVLVIVADLTSAALVDDLEMLVREVSDYDPGLGARIAVVVGNKIDLAEADVEEARRWTEARGLRFIPISAEHGTNVDGLLAALLGEVTSARERQGEPESFAVFRPVTEDPVTVVREGDAFRVRNARAERLIAMTPLENPRAVRRLQRGLKRLGVEDALRREGAEQGDEVRIGDASFEYEPEEP